MRVSKEDFKLWAQALWDVLKEDPQGPEDVPQTLRPAVASLRLFLGIDKLNPLVTDTDNLAKQLEKTPSKSVMTGSMGWQVDANGHAVLDQVWSSAGKLAAANLRRFAGVWDNMDRRVVPNPE